MSKVIEEEILYQDSSKKEFIKTQIFEDGTSRTLTVLNDKQKAARLTMRLIHLLNISGES